MKFDIPDIELMFADFDWESHIIILGTTGEGKTTLLQRILHDWKPSIGRIVVFNPVNLPSYKLLADISIDETAIIGNQLHGLLNDKKNKVIVITPNERIRQSDNQMQALWNSLCGQIYSYEDKIFTKIQHNGGVKEVMRKAFIMLINDDLPSVVFGELLVPMHRILILEGRNHAINLVSAFQRHMDVPKKITDNSKWKIVFGMDERMIQYLSKALPIVEEARDLPPHHFIMQKNRYNKKYYSPVKEVFKDAGKLTKEQILKYLIEEKMQEKKI